MLSLAVAGLTMHYKKLKKLREILKGLDRVVVAYSGGVDSTFLLRMAKEVLGPDNVLAVTAKSESFPRRELQEAQDIAQRLNIKQLTVRTHELKNKQFARNPVNRCYYCKKELFSDLRRIARKHGTRHVIDGSNRDDLNDLRHGRKAAQELGITSPLVEAGLGKKEIRQLSKGMLLPTWNKSTFACLASRFPYGQKIDARSLKQIEEAEDFLKSLGFKQVRVRLHGQVARIEVGSNEVKRCLQSALRKRIITKLKKLRFNYITLDLAGYRSGSMNEILS
jgi:uncharacterized protein